MLLIYIYVFSFVIGAVLLGASLLLGHHEGSGELHADADADADADASADAGAGDAGHDLAHADHEIGHEVAFSDFWLPFVSVRFWVFFLCFFGLTGTIFTLFGLAEKWASLASSLGVGLVSGFGAAYFIQRLRRVEVGTALGVEDFKGREATVLLPLGPGCRGKIRLELRGQTVDLVARTEGDGACALERGRRVLIIDFAGSEALVVPSSELGVKETTSEEEGHHAD